MITTDKGIVVQSVKQNEVPAKLLDLRKIQPDPKVAVILKQELVGSLESDGGSSVGGKLSLFGCQSAPWSTATMVIISSTSKVKNAFLC